MWHGTFAIAIGLLLAQVATFDTTIYLHRCQTHGAFKVSPGVHRFFRLLNWLLTGQITREWVAVHRKHHAFSDEDGDPHSPYLVGFWQVQLADVFYYVREKNDPETIRKYGRDVYSDRFDLLFNTGVLGPIIGLTALCLMMGVGWGLLAGFVHAFCYVGVLTSCVNAIGHHSRTPAFKLLGFTIPEMKVPAAYQNYGERFKAEKTFNYRWLAWITGGEGLHNNHHGKPNCAFLAHHENEDDPARPVIKWMERLGLAWDVHYV